MLLENLRNLATDLCLSTHSSHPENRTFFSSDITLPLHHMYHTYHIIVYFIHITS